MGSSGIGIFLRRGTGLARLFAGILDSVAAGAIHDPALGAIATGISRKEVPVMRHSRLISLIALLAVTFLPAPHALATPNCGFTDGDCLIVGAPGSAAFLLLGSGLVGVAGIVWRRHRRK
jgi:hypothetical protein